NQKSREQCKTYSGGRIQKSAAPSLQNFVKIHAESERDDRRLQQKSGERATIVRERVQKCQTKNNPRAQRNRRRNKSGSTQNQQQKENCFCVHTCEKECPSRAVVKRDIATRVIDCCQMPVAGKRDANNLLGKLRQPLGTQIFGPRHGILDGRKVPTIAG